MKRREKISVSYEHGKQLSIRNFFSNHFRKESAFRNNSEIASSTGTTAPLEFDGKKVEADGSSLKQIENKSDNNFQNDGGMSSNHLKFNAADSLTRKPLEGSNFVPEKRKYEDDVLADILDECKNSQEDYIYSDSLISSKKKHDLSLSKLKNTLNLKRSKLHVSPWKKQNIFSHKNNIDGSAQKNKMNGPLVGTKISDYEGTNLDISSTDDTSTTPNFSSRDNQFIGSNVKKNEFNLTDIENLTDLFTHEWDDMLIQNQELNLSKWTYCEVKNIEMSNLGIILQLEENGKQSSKMTATCVLKGCWSDTPVKINDIVSIKAHFDSVNKYWSVDNEEGFIVIFPDTLITGTGVVGSLFCLRQSVLGYIFPETNPPNVAMIIGSLVHELLQEILKNSIYTLDGMKQITENLVQNKRTLFLAYESDVSLSSIKTELDEFIPKIYSFINVYITETENQQKSWSGTILEILSIEENFWIPQLGIKGKTDIILKARSNNEIKILPLELKTGRVTNSVEHRGQIILYVMMMCESEMNVDSGLLLYLRGNELTEIKPKHPERSGLLNMRNNLVNYIVVNETLKLISEDEFELPILPEPINHHRGCSKCPYLTVCSASLSKVDRETMAENNPLNKLSEKALEHLSATHIRYVFFWLGLLKLEELERKNNRSCNISDIWHTNSAERESRGYCLSTLRVESIEIIGSRFLHKMKRANDTQFNFSNCGLIEGDYVIISKGNRFAIATGYVHDISRGEISFKLDRKLEKCDEAFYTVDKYSVYSGLLGFNTSSLLLLLEDSVQAQRLRSFVVDKKIPIFSNISDPDLKYDENILHGLNSSQREAVLKALQIQDYMLIKGMPGTGKTATIVALIKLLASLNYSIIITSHTHTAVDNILLRLSDSVDFLRLGSSARVHKSLKKYCEEYILENKHFETVQNLENFYYEKQIIAVTCMGCTHALFRRRQFDYCIVDEATQVLQPSIIKSLYYSKKFVLIGDPDQLPPVVQSSKAKDIGLGESLFKRLDKPDVTSVLYLQYRMNSVLMKLANSFAYENTLQCANELISSATINVQESQCNTSKWLKLALSPNLNHSVILLNTSELQIAEPVMSEYSNKSEVKIAFTILKSLMRICNETLDVGIIAPYREQVELLRRTAQLEDIQTEINTVDQYQGRDKDVIIYSCTKSSSSGDNGILSDKNRLTVAITRAKRKLIIIGNVSTLNSYTVFRELFGFISTDNIIDVDCI